MNIEIFREHCIRKPGVTEDFPFGVETLVFKVSGKMFALTNVDLFSSINLKCDPEEAVLLREQYTSVRPGYHMNKRHWNTIDMDGTIPDPLIFKWLDQSYDLVFESLTIQQKQILKQQLS